MMRFYRALILNIFTFTACCLMGQVRIVNSTSNSAAASSSAFIDASSNVSNNSSTNVGKGLVFPRTNLTTFTAISGSPFVANSYPTRFDGMIVYNTATGTAGIGTALVTPGFYYYSNQSTVSANAGQWIRLANQDDLKTPSGSTLPTTATPGDVFYNTTDNSLYYYKDTQWVPVTSTPSGTTLPTTTASKIGDLFYLTNLSDPSQSLLEIYNGTAWVPVGIMLDATGENYLSLSGQTLKALPVDLSGSNATGTLAADRFPALTGDVTNTAGSLVTTIGDNKIKTSMIQDGAVTDAKLATGIDASKITTGTLPSSVIPTTLPGVTSVGGLDITTSGAGFSIKGGTPAATLTVPSDATVSGSNTGDQDASKVDLNPSSILGITGTTVQAALTDIGSKLTQQATDIAKKLDANVAITAGTNYSIVKYDTKGLVTDGKTPTTADISASTDKNYVTDAQLSIIQNTSGTNTGDISLTNQSGANYLSLSGQALTAKPVDLSTSDVTGTLPATKLPTSLPGVTSIGGMTIATNPAFKLSDGTNTITISGANTSISGQNTGDQTLNLDKTNHTLTISGANGNTVSGIGTITDVQASASSGLNSTVDANGIASISLATNAVATANLQGSSGALDKGTSGNVLKSNGNGTFSWLDISTGIPVDPSSIALSPTYVFIGNTSGKAEGYPTSQIPLNTLGIAQGTVNMGDGTTNFSISNLKDPTQPQDAATKNYVDTKAILTTQKGATNGVAPLNASGIIDTQYLPSSLVGAVTYVGTIDLTSATVPLATTSNKGNYYVCTTDGGTYGADTYNTGDWIISDGTTWSRVANHNAVTSVLGKTGVVTFNTDNIDEGTTHLYYTESRVTNNPTVVALGTNKEDKANKNIDGTFTANVDDTHYPSMKAVKTYVDAKVPSTTGIANDWVLTVESQTPVWKAVTGGGTVKTISITPNQGITGTVTSDAVNPAITLSLGAITPTSITTGNITSTGNITTTGTITGSNIGTGSSIGTNTSIGKNITIPDGTIISGSNTGDQVISLTGDVTGTGNSPTTSIPTTIALGAITPSKLNATGSPVNGSALTYTTTGFAWGGVPITSLSYAASPTGGTLTTNSGSTPIGLADGTNAGLMTPADYTKLSGLSTYSLPIASASSLGGIKVGSGLSIDASGVLSASGTGTISAITPNDGLSASVASGTATLGINNAGIAYSKLATIADKTLLGNNSGSTASPTAIAATAIPAMIGLGNVENTKLSTWTGSTAITTLGTITAGTWNGNVIDIAHGGTGATTTTAARTALLPAQSSNAGKVLQTNGTDVSWVTPTSGTITSVTATATDGLSGGTVTSGVVTIGLTDAAVPLAKLVKIGTSTILGNSSTTTAASPAALSIATVQSMLSLNLKQDVSNLSTDANFASDATGANADIMYPSVLAIKNYVDAKTSAAGSGDMILADVQSVTGKKTFDNTTLAMKATGSNTGVTTIANANASSTSYTITLPAETGTLALKNDPLSQFASTTSAQLASIISGKTGTGDLVFATSPTLVTPNLGVASATSITATGNITTTAGNVSGKQLISTVADGTPPLIVTSTTPVANLTATNASKATITDNTTITTAYPTWVSSTTGNQSLYTSSTNLSLNPSTGTLTAKYFSGDGSLLTNLNATNLTSGTIQAGRYGAGSIPIASLVGYPSPTDGTKFLAGDGNWKTISASGVSNFYYGYTAGNPTATLTLVSASTFTPTIPVLIDGSTADAGLMIKADKSKLSSYPAATTSSGLVLTTNSNGNATWQAPSLGYTPSTGALSLTTGGASSSITIPQVANASTSTNPGLMSSADKTKLDTYPSSTTTSGLVLTTNSNGNASWQAPSGGSGGSASTIYKAVAQDGTTTVPDVLAKGSGGKVKYWIDNTGATTVLNVSIPSGSILDYIRIHIDNNTLKSEKCIVNLIDEAKATNNNYQDALFPYVSTVLMNATSPDNATPWAVNNDTGTLVGISVENCTGGTLSLILNNFTSIGGGGAYIILNF